MILCLEIGKVLHSAGKNNMFLDLTQIIVQSMSPLFLDKTKV
jgi:hypothetical protein